MRLFQKRIYLFIQLVLFMFIFIIPTISVAAEAAGAAAEIPKPSRYITATYFHNTVRCPTCHKIEELSTEAVRNNFAKQLKDGTLVWRVINVDEPQNQHYNKDYQLYTKSLIVSEIKDGKEVRYKNLEKIWTYVRNEQDFDQYVTSEIKDWMKE